MEFILGLQAIMSGLPEAQISAKRTRNLFLNLKAIALLEV